MKKKIVVISIIIILIIIGVIVSVYIIEKNNKIEQQNKETFAKNISMPDRIVYKNKEKYYEINQDEELYKEIVEKISKKVDTNKTENSITQEEVDDMHQLDSFIEFDYNTISKNYILTIENKSKFVKLLDSGGELIENNISGAELIQKFINSKIENKDYYTMEQNKEYISQNLVKSMEYKYLQQFKAVGNNGQIYQTVIKDNESFELYSAMCNLKIDEEISEDIFDKNVIVLTLSIPRDIKVKTNIGNLRYYYENKTNNYEYTAHLYVVSKIVNSNCIYNVDNEAIKEQANLKDLEDQYDNQVNTLDTNTFKNSSTNSTEKQNTNKEITKEEADEIAEQGFKEAQRIVGQYSKDTQEVTIEEVYANNFFTRKSYETDTVYNNQPKVKCYVYTRTDDMLNGVSIYVDINTGKIIGGRAFGD